MAGRAARIEPVRVGIIGCGFASELYLTTLADVALVDVVACADVRADQARQVSARFGIERVLTVGELLGDDSVELVANLTPPSEHFAVTLAALRAGKSVYSEKPLALTTADGRELLALAARSGLVLGCAPDTVLCSAAQSSRRVIEQGVLGQPFAAQALDFSAGHEKWHPGAGFYYAPGGGPLFDLGPYPLTWLVNLFGPVSKVYGSGRVGHKERRLRNRSGAEDAITVDVCTHVSALAEFRDGLALTLGLSFDVAAPGHSVFEAYGSGGTLSLPDPCDGQGLAVFRGWGGAGHADVAPQSGFTGSAGKGIGLADVACALRFGSPVRASADVALHVLDVMEGIVNSAGEDRPVEVRTSCLAPPPVPAIDIAELADPESAWTRRYADTS